ncbi:MAG: FAD:protein FMN transferase [FCB group bacterium]|nr:FAD:protein FMN transferase [FCB group bacterium]
MKNKLKVRLLIPGFLFLILSVCSYKKPQIQFYGQTMGTTYSIKIAGVSLTENERSRLYEELDSLIQGVNERMSTYLDSSELSLVNADHTTDPIPLSPELYRVIKRGQEVSGMTGGAFDITVQPLVRLWGFGNTGRRWTPPNDYEIKALLDEVGYKNLTLTGNALVKKNPNAEIDLSAIAKGYAVDSAAEFLIAEGYENFMVEIGGEVSCGGVNAQGDPWQIGIQYPDDAVEDAMKLIGKVSLREKAMATSGNYRNYFDYNGERFSHTIDPKTGYPVTNKVVSSTVIARNCMDADAYATSLMVLGPEAGLKWINSLDGTECFMVEMDIGGNLTQMMSSGFQRYFTKNEN